MSFYVGMKGCAGLGSLVRKDISFGFCSVWKGFFGWRWVDSVEPCFLLAMIFGNCLSLFLELGLFVGMMLVREIPSRLKLFLGFGIENIV